MRKKAIRSPRLERKTRKKKIQKAVILSLLGVGILSLSIYALLQPEFRIQRIGIDGSESLPREEITSLVKQGLSGKAVGLIPREHTLLFPKRRLEAAIAAAFPIFSDVRVAREGLSAVRVSLISRTPYVIWCESSCYFVDETGFAFATSTKEADQLYYRFARNTVATSTPLGRFVAEPQRLRELSTLVQQLEELSLAVSEVQLGEEEVTAVLRGGARLLLPGTDFDGAVGHLRRLLAEKGLVARAGGGLLVEYVDLRYGNKIYVK